MSPPRSHNPLTFSQGNLAVMSTNSKPQSATKQSYELMDYRELCSEYLPAGKHAMFVRRAAQAKERGDFVCFQEMLEQIKDLEREHWKDDLASQSLLHISGEYMPPVLQQYEQQQQPDTTGNLIYMPHAPQQQQLDMTGNLIHMPQATSQYPMSLQAPAPLPVFPAPTAMLPGSGPVPGPAYQGPNHPQPMPAVTAYDAAKRPRNERSDKGQPRSRKSRTPASSSSSSSSQTVVPAPSEPASKRPRTKSPAEMQRPVEQLVAVWSPGREERSEEDLDQQRDRELFGSDSPAQAQEAVADSTIDPTLLAMDANRQLPADSTIAAPDGNLLGSLGLFNSLTEDLSGPAESTIAAPDGTPLGSLGLFNSRPEDLSGPADLPPNSQDIDFLNAYPDVSTLSCDEWAAVIASTLQDNSQSIDQEPLAQQPGSTGQSLGMFKPGYLDVLCAEGEQNA